MLKGHTRSKRKISPNKRSRLLNNPSATPGSTALHALSVSHLHTSPSSSAHTSSSHVRIIKSASAQDGSAINNVATRRSFSTEAEQSSVKQRLTSNLHDSRLGTEYVDHDKYRSYETHSSRFNDIPMSIFPEDEEFSLKQYTQQRSDVLSTTYKRNPVHLSYSLQILAAHNLNPGSYSDSSRTWVRPGRVVLDGRRGAQSLLYVDQASGMPGGIDTNVDKVKDMMMRNLDFARLLPAMKATTLPSSLHLNNLALHTIYGRLKDDALNTSVYQQQMEYLQHSAHEKRIAVWDVKSGNADSIVGMNYAIPGLLVATTHEHIGSVAAMGGVALPVSSIEASGLLLGQPIHITTPRAPYRIVFTGDMPQWTSIQDVTVLLTQLIGELGYTRQHGTDAPISLEISDKDNVFTIDELTLLCQVLGSMPNVGAITVLPNATQRRYLRDTHRGAQLQILEEYSEQLLEPKGLADYSDSILMNLSKVKPLFSVMNASSSFIPNISADAHAKSIQSDTLSHQPGFNAISSPIHYLDVMSGTSPSDHRVNLAHLYHTDNIIHHRDIFTIASQQERSRTHDIFYNRYDLIDGSPRFNEKKINAISSKNATRPKLTSGQAKGNKMKEFSNQRALTDSNLFSLVDPLADTSKSTVLDLHKTRKVNSSTPLNEQELLQAQREIEKEMLPRSPTTAHSIEGSADVIDVSPQLDLATTINQATTRTAYENEQEKQELEQKRTQKIKSIAGTAETDTNASTNVLPGIREKIASSIVGSNPKLTKQQELYKEYEKWQSTGQQLAINKTQFWPSEADMVFITGGYNLIRDALHILHQYVHHINTLQENTSRLPGNSKKINSDVKIPTFIQCDNENSYALLLRDGLIDLARDAGITILSHGDLTPDFILSAYTTQSPTLAAKRKLFPEIPETPAALSQPAGLSDDGITPLPTRMTVLTSDMMLSQRFGGMSHYTPHLFMASSEYLMVCALTGVTNYDPINNPLYPGLDYQKLMTTMNQKSQSGDLRQRVTHQNESRKFTSQQHAPFPIASTGVLPKAIDQSEAFFLASKRSRKTIDPLTGKLAVPPEDENETNVDDDFRYVIPTSTLPSTVARGRESLILLPLHSSKTYNAQYKNTMPIDELYGLDKIEALSLPQSLQTEKLQSGGISPQTLRKFTHIEDNADDMTSIDPNDIILHQFMKQQDSNIQSIQQSFEVDNRPINYHMLPPTLMGYIRNRTYTVKDRLSSVYKALNDDKKSLIQRLLVHQSQQVSQLGPNASLSPSTSTLYTKNPHIEHGVTKSYVLSPDDNKPKSKLEIAASKLFDADTLPSVPDLDIYKQSIQVGKIVPHPWHQSSNNHLVQMPVVINATIDPSAADIIGYTGTISRSNDINRFNWNMFREQLPRYLHGSASDEPITADSQHPASTSLSLTNIDHHHLDSDVIVDVIKRRLPHRALSDFLFPFDNHMLDYYYGLSGLRAKISSAVSPTDSTDRFTIHSSDLSKAALALHHAVESSHTNNIGVKSLQKLKAQVEDSLKKELAIIKKQQAAIDAYIAQFKQQDAKYRSEDQHREDARRKKDEMTTQAAKQSQWERLKLQDEYANKDFWTMGDIEQLTDKHSTSTIIVDVREPEEFKDAHIPGAINVPLSKLEDILQRQQKLFQMPPPTDDAATVTTAEVGSKPQSDYFFEPLKQDPNDPKVKSADDRDDVDLVLPPNHPQIRYLIHCRAGVRSVRATHLFQRYGYTKHLYNVVDGMLSWNGSIVDGFEDHHDTAKYLSKVAASPLEEVSSDQQTAKQHDDNNTDAQSSRQHRLTCQDFENVYEYMPSDDVPTVSQILHPSNKILVVDVREDHEYEAGHIPGAVSYPLSRLADEAHELKHWVDTLDKELYIHCRSGVRSLRAQDMLLSQDLPADRLFHIDDGFLGWNGPVNTGKDEHLDRIQSLEYEQTVREQITRETEERQAKSKLLDEHRQLQALALENIINTTSLTPEQKEQRQAEYKQWIQKDNELQQRKKQWNAVREALDSTFKDLTTQINPHGEEDQDTTKSGSTLHEKHAVLPSYNTLPFWLNTSNTQSKQPEVKKNGPKRSFGLNRQPQPADEQPTLSQLMPSLFPGTVSKVSVPNHLSRSTAPLQSAVLQYFTNGTPWVLVGDGARVNNEKQQQLLSQRLPGHSLTRSSGTVKEEHMFQSSFDQSGVGYGSVIEADQAAKVLKSLGCGLVVASRVHYNFQRALNAHGILSMEFDSNNVSSKITGLDRISVSQLVSDVISSENTTIELVHHTNAAHNPLDKNKGSIKTPSDQPTHIIRTASPYNPITSSWMRAGGLHNAGTEFQLRTMLDYLGSYDFHMKNDGKHRFDTFAFDPKSDSLLASSLVGGGKQWMVDVLTKYLPSRASKVEIKSTKDAVQQASRAVVELRNTISSALGQRTKGKLNPDISKDASAAPQQPSKHHE